MIWLAPMVAGITPAVSAAGATSVSIKETSYAAVGANAEASMLTLVAVPSSSHSRTTQPRSPSSAGLKAVTTTLGASTDRKLAVGAASGPPWLRARAMACSGF